MGAPASLRAILFVSIAWGIAAASQRPPGGAAVAAEAGGERILPEAPVEPLPPALATVVVQVAGKPLPLSEAIRLAAADQRWTTYRQLREEDGGNADGERRLAIWCRKQKLAEEERLHWWTLLSLEPGHPDAIRALHLHEYQGALLTREEIDHAKQTEQAAKKAERTWRPKLTQLKRAIIEGDDAERAAALRQLQAVNDPHALPLLEEIFLLENVDIVALIGETVEKMPGDDAAELLARLAVDSSDEYIRERAIAALQSRPYHSYVPQLVGRLATPIELDVRVAVEPGGTTAEEFTAYAYTGEMGPAFYHVHRPNGAYANGDVAAWGAKVRRTSGTVVTGYQPDRLQYHYVLRRESADPDNPDQLTGTFEGARGDARPVASLEDLEAQIAADNEATAALNERLHAVLIKATRVDVLHGALQQADARAELVPRRWWDWWRGQTQSNQYISAGIEVWTQTGPTPIENLLPGDRVLSRDPATNELAFRLVLGVDQQPGAAMQAVELAGRTIVAAPQQLFSVVGAGWRPASEVKAGVQLECLSGPRAIDRVGPTEAVARFSLWIAGAPNYYVDQQALLVHDATRP